MRVPKRRERSLGAPHRPASGGLLGASAPRAHAEPDRREARQAQAVLVQLQQLDAAAQRANSRLPGGQPEAATGQAPAPHQPAGARRRQWEFPSCTAPLRGEARRDLHTEDEQSSLAVILGARSLDISISRIETVNSMSKQNTALIHQVLSFQHQIVRRRGRCCMSSVSRQTRLVTARAAERNRIEGGSPPSGGSTARFVPRSRR